MPDEIKHCSQCEHLILVGAYHRPECSEKDYLPEIVKVGDHYEPVCDNCQDFLPIGEPRMDKPKFTPGPWKAHHGVMEPDYVFYGEEENCDVEKRVIAEVYQRPEPYRNYDVDLIAAAPEMYEELERFIELCHENDCGDYARRAEQILRKARGESEDEA